MRANADLAVMQRNRSFPISELDTTTETVCPSLGSKRTNSLKQRPNTTIGIFISVLEMKRFESGLEVWDYFCVGVPPSERTWGCHASRIHQTAPPLSPSPSISLSLSLLPSNVITRRKKIIAILIRSAGNEPRCNRAIIKYANNYLTRRH